MVFNLCNFSKAQTERPKAGEDEIEDCQSAKKQLNSRHTNNMVLMFQQGQNSCHSP